MYRSLTISSRSTILPIDTSAINSHLKIQTTVEDSLITNYLKAGCRVLTNKIRRAIVPTSYLMEHDVFIDDIELPFPPLSTASSDVVITYINSSGGTSTASSTVYTVDYKCEPGRIYLAYDASWPSDVRSVEGAIKIAYSAGYTTATIPDNAIEWLKQWVGVAYKYREPVIDIRTAALQRYFFDGLIDDLIVYSTSI